MDMWKEYVAKHFGLCTVLYNVFFHTLAPTQKCKAYIVHPRDLRLYEANENEYYLTGILELWL